MSEPVFYLHSAGLLSKWGFNDGDVPDEVFDYFYYRGIDYHPFSWRPVLEQLVRSYLLPALDQRVTAVHIETAHNPIRAETVDGVNVSHDVWHDGGGPELTPATITIPMSKVAELVAAQQAGRRGAYERDLREE